MNKGIAEGAMLGIGVGVVAAVILAAMVIVNTFLGAVGAWIVGLVFGDTILGVLATVGIHNVTMWQLGATLGFIGGYIRSVVTVNKSES